LVAQHSSEVAEKDGLFESVKTESLAVTEETEAI